MKKGDDGDVNSGDDNDCDLILLALLRLKPGRGLVPGVTGLRQMITQIEQLAHVIRVEHLFGFQLEMVRDIGQVIVESIPQGAKIESIKISKSLVPEER